MPEPDRATEVQRPPSAAEEAGPRLRGAGALGYSKTRARLNYRGKVDRLWGGIRGLFSVFGIRGTGSALVAGPLAWIAGAMEVVGLGAIGAGLNALGLRRDRVIQRETGPRPDKLLVVGEEQPLTSREPQ